MHGFICECSFDSTAVGFPFVPDELFELGATFYCNCCGAVYDNAERLLPAATDRLRAEHPELVLGPGYPASSGE